MEKILVHSSENVGSYDDDDDFYLSFDEDANEYIILHTYHHFRPNGTRRGTDERLTLTEARRISETAYKNALAEIQKIEAAKS